MLDLVESCLLRPLGVSSLRLDGSVDAGARFGVVQRFNSDPTIQVRTMAEVLDNDLQLARANCGGWKNWSFEVMWGWVRYCMP
jgi:hypothetical protein